MVASLDSSVLLKNPVCAVLQQAEEHHGNMHMAGEHYCNACMSDRELQVTLDMSCVNDQLTASHGLTTSSGDAAAQSL